ncbi:MAG: hypothetical protein AAF799_04530 [Myxococcota bacterium]
MNKMCTRCSYDELQAGVTATSTAATGNAAENLARQAVPNGASGVICSHWQNADNVRFDANCVYNTTVHRTTQAHCAGRFRGYHEPSQQQLNAEQQSITAARNAVPQGATNVDCDTWRARA